MGFHRGGLGDAALLHNGRTPLARDAPPTRAAARSSTTGASDAVDDANADAAGTSPNLSSNTGAAALPPPVSPPPPTLSVSFNLTTGIDISLHHLDNSLIVYESGAGACDVAVWIRMDFTQAYDGTECLGANHWVNLDAHAPPDHGGHIHDDRSDIGNYSWVALTGKYDSDDPNAVDAQLEPTGTYSLCLAKWSGEPNCTTWVPEPADFVHYSNVQIHLTHYPPSAQRHSNPRTHTRAHTHPHRQFSRSQNQTPSNTRSSPMAPPPPVP